MNNLILVLVYNLIYDLTYNLVYNFKLLNNHLVIMANIIFLLFV